MDQRNTESLALPRQSKLLEPTPTIRRAAILALAAGGSCIFLDILLDFKRHGGLYTLVGLIICWLTLVLIRFLYIRRRKNSQMRLNSSFDLNRLRPGEFVLYLRPFFISGSTMVRNGLPRAVDRFLYGQYWDFEFALSLILRDDELVALGHVEGEFGATKITTNDKDWFALFSDLATKAGAVFIVPLNRPSTIRELRHILATPDIRAKSVFVMPPRLYRPLVFLKLLLRGRTLGRSWNAMRAQISDTIVFPRYSRKGALIFFDASANAMSSIKLARCEQDYLSETVSIARSPNVSKSDAYKSLRPPPPFDFFRYLSQVLFSVDTIIASIGGLIIVMIISGFLYKPYNIPSRSMEPPLQIGDFIFVSKSVYGFSHLSSPISAGLSRGRILASAPKRGDIVVFKLPRDNATDYIKRVIGLPGETVQVKQGRLYINGAIVPREPIAKVRTEDYMGEQADVPTYRETLPGGVAHTIIEIQGDTGFNDNTEVFKVPEDNYFMMGDNRDNSTDSRVPADQGGVGYVPSENLIGRADLVFFSLEPGASGWKVWQWPWTVRWGRLFTRVR